MNPEYFWIFSENLIFIFAYPCLMTYVNLDMISASNKYPVLFFLEEAWVSLFLKDTSVCEYKILNILIKGHLNTIFFGIRLISRVQICPNICYVNVWHLKYLDIHLVNYFVSEWIWIFVCIHSLIFAHHGVLMKVPWNMMPLITNFVLLTVPEAFLSHIKSRDRSAGWQLIKQIIYSQSYIQCFNTI